MFFLLFIFKDKVRRSSVLSPKFFSANVLKSSANEATNPPRPDRELLKQAGFFYYLNVFILMDFFLKTTDSNFKMVILI
jgi:hypothetical protein